MEPEDPRPGWRRAADLWGGDVGVQAIFDAALRLREEEDRPMREGELSAAELDAIEALYIATPVNGLTNIAARATRSLVDVPRLVAAVRTRGAERDSLRARIDDLEQEVLTWEDFNDPRIRGGYRPPTARAALAEWHAAHPPEGIDYEP